MGDRDLLAADAVRGRRRAEIQRSRACPRGAGAAAAAAVPSAPPARAAAAPARHAATSAASSARPASSASAARARAPRGRRSARSARRGRRAEGEEVDDVQQVLLAALVGRAVALDRAGRTAAISWPSAAVVARAALDRGKPALDQRLLGGEAAAVPAPVLQRGERAQRERAGDGVGADLHRQRPRVAAARDARRVPARAAGAPARPAAAPANSATPGLRCSYVLHDLVGAARRPRAARARRATRATSARRRARRRRTSSTARASASPRRDRVRRARAPGRRRARRPRCARMRAS